MEDVLQQQAAIEQSPPPQKTLTQEQVNAIVAKEKQRAAEAARREVEERYQREMEASNLQRQNNQNVSRDVDINSIYQQVQEKFNLDQDRLRKELEDKQLQDHMNQVANNYLSKVESAKGSYGDFDDVTKEFDPSSFPQLVYLLSGMDNAGHVLYDLAKNPLKLAAIDRLAEKNPKQAMSELNKLSQSILTNQKAQAEAQQGQTLDPLDRLSPSQVAGNNGQGTIRDLRSQSWLRG